jgi:hypothetical protein
MHASRVVIVRSSRANLIAIAFGLILSACAGEVVSTIFEDVGEEVPEPAADTPEAAAFDLALVKSNYIEECADPIVLDELFCKQIQIKRMTADGTTLIVPTTINATGMKARADIICEQIALVHFDGATGELLGFEEISVLDRNGDENAYCVIRD